MTRLYSRRCSTNIASWNADLSKRADAMGPGAAEVQPGGICTRALRERASHVIDVDVSLDGARYRPV
jgi:hypothetical protein